MERTYLEDLFVSIGQSNVWVGAAPGLLDENCETKEVEIILVMIVLVLAVISIDTTPSHPGHGVDILLIISISEFLAELLPIIHNLFTFAASKCKH